LNEDIGSVKEGRRNVRRGWGGRRCSEGTRKGVGEFVEELLGGIIRR
jgi:hypothetical protein